MENRNAAHPIWVLRAVISRAALAVLLLTEKVSLPIYTIIFKYFFYLFGNLGGRYRPIFILMSIE